MSWEQAAVVVGTLTSVISLYFEARAHVRARTSQDRNTSRRHVLLLGLGAVLLLVGIGSMVARFVPRISVPLLETDLVAVGLVVAGALMVGLVVLLRRKQADRRTADERQLAEHLVRQIEFLNLREQWHDKQYAELPATVELADEHGPRAILAWLREFNRGVRAVKSLTDTLERSTARLILLEGDPGSGKSVALRHLAIDLGLQAARAGGKASVIPVYVNLKDLRVEAGPVDAELIRSYVLQTIKRANDPDVNAFVDAEFAPGLRAGKWLFLFDSFDEIPAILSATEVNETVQGYAEALFNFIHGLHESRGVIASREFRGPTMPFQAKFRIRNLTEEQKQNLVTLALSKTHPEAARTLIGSLPTADPGIQQLSGNALFLSLLCDHMRRGHPFPISSHSVFQTYVDARLQKQDRSRIERLRISPARVRILAEQLAYCMTAEPELGLAPDRVALCRAMERHGFPGGHEVVEAMDALQVIKLAKPPDVHETEGSLPFEFVHRRIQEYFATCVVLREPHRVTPHQLLTDGV
jgi:hypothetical protein